MLEERTKAEAVVDLQYSLACFEVDWRGAIKKIQDVNFDPLSATSTSEVKIDQPPPRSSMTHDECAAMLNEHMRLVEIQTQENLDKFMAGCNKREEKKTVPVFSSRCIC